MRRLLYNTMKRLRIGVVVAQMVVVIAGAQLVMGQPANDDFDNAAGIVGPFGTFSGSNIGATREPGEPNHWPTSGGHSVWHIWTAPYDGTVSFDTQGSYFDTILAIYTGTNVAALTLVGNNDDYPGLGLASKVTFQAVGGTEYRIAIDGYRTDSVGLYILNWYYETTQTNPPAPPLGPNQIQFAETNIVVNENIPGFVKIYVNTGGGNTAPIAVNYATSNLTAIAGVDYIARSGTLIFNPGETNKSFTVQIIDNAVVNSNKMFTVHLFSPAGGASLGLWSNAMVTIVDDETAPYASTAGELQFTASLYGVTEREYTVWNSDGYRSVRGALITVNRINGNTGRVLVDYIVTNAFVTNNIPPTNVPPNSIRPALPGWDYLPATGTLVFDDGQTSTNFIVQIFGDNRTNGTAEVQLFLRNPRPAPEEDPALIRPTLGIQSNAVLQIYEVTTQPTFAFERLHYRVNEYGNASITIAILLPGGGGSDVWVDVGMGSPWTWGALNAGSDYARPGQDYQDMSQRVYFAANESRKTITIPIYNDTIVEFNEDIPITLWRSNGRGINPNARYATVTILYDDQPPGAADREWNPHNVPYTTPPFNQLPGANNQVYSVVVQPDNKAIIAGDFTSVNTIPRNRIARFNPNGSLDTNFLAHPNTGADAFISQVALMSPFSGTNANKIIIAGGFSSFNGYLRNCIARLNQDGSLDLSFNPGGGANAPIWAIAVQTDGKIVIGGEFTAYNDVPRNHIARLNPDGSLDMTFNPPGGTDGNVWSVLVQETGIGGPKVYIGGDFTICNGELRRGIARLNDDGTLDYTFDPGTGADGIIYSMALQANGALVIGGSFTEIDSKPRNNIARLNPDGTLDLTFNPGTGANDTIYSVVLRPSDQHIYIGGLFTSYNQTRRIGLALVNPDGTLDTTFMDTAYNQFAGFCNVFSFQPKNFVRSIALQEDGNLMIGGSFTNVGGNFALYLNEHTSYAPVWTRQDKIPRANVARIIGTWGTTINSEGNPVPNPPQGPGNADFLTSEYFIDENQSVMNVTMMRRNGVIGTLGVYAYTSNRIAVAGLDYGSVSAPQIFSEWYGWMRSDGYPGPIYLQIPIIDDNLVEGNETLDIGLSRPYGQINLGGEIIPLGGALGRTYATLTIVDNDFDYGILAFSSASFTTNENATNLIVTVIRTNGSVGTVTVDYYTMNGSAIAGSGGNPGDYTSVRGTLTFPSGVTSRNIVIPLYDDTDVEFDETFYVVLTNATGGAKLPGGTPTSTLTTTCIIIDNDFPSGRLNFTTTNYVSNEGERFVTVTVTRIGGNLGPLSVSVVTSNGTAIAGLDYVFTSNRLSWVHGETTPKSVTIPILDDALVEGTESFTVNLVNPSVSGSIGSMSSATVLIEDDDAYGAFQFSQPQYSADENGTNITITVVRLSGSAGTVSVNYYTMDASATAGIDYLQRSGTLTFEPGVVSKNFSVRVIDNQTQDGDRIFRVVLSNPTGGASLGAISNAVVNIIDDESVSIPAGSVDTTFVLGTGPNRPVHSLLLQPDGSIIIGGEFTSYNNIVRKGIARLTPIGRLDPGFDIGDGFNDQLRAMALQVDGRIVVGGFFTSVNGVNRNRIARLNTDGTLDLFFNPGAGADRPVYAIAIQNDGRILVGGSFTTFNGISRPGLVRLNTNGTINASFDVGNGVDGTVYAIAIQPDGKILIGGDFTRVNNIPFGRIARLNPNGSIDSTFNPGLGADSAVRAIVIQSDGKILVGGSFTNFNGVSRNYLVRLNKDGSIDNGFMAGLSGANESVYAIALQADEKIVVAGSFTRFNDVTRNGITRLNQDGTTDPSINFGTGANGFVAAVVVQPDRKIVLGGGFTMFDGKPRNHLVRLHGGSLAGSGTLQFGNPYYTVNEGETIISLDVLRRGGTYGTVTVKAVTADGTAIDAQDYSGITNTLTFPSGEVIQTIRIPIIDDNIVEPTELFYVYLDEATGGADIGIVPVATIRIESDDCIISFANTDFPISENTPTGQARVTVIREGSTNGIATVYCQVVSNALSLNPATPDFDYTPVAETLVFQPGQTSIVFLVPIINDYIIEGNETALLTLSNPTPTNSAFLGVSNAVLTIIDDDAAPGVIEFARTNFYVGENKGNAVISLIRTNGSSGVVSVKFTTINGSAIGGLDFQVTSGTVAFADGETTKIFTIPIINDKIVEDDEIFYVYLSDPLGGAALGTITNAAVKIYDDDFAVSYFRFIDTNIVVNEYATNAVVTVLRGGFPEGQVSVDYLTADGTAVAGLDYLPVSGTLVWSDGDDTPKTFIVPLIDDTLGEAPETVLLILTNPSPGSVIASTNNVLTIMSDDTTFRFVTNNFYVAENISNAVITVERVGVINNGAVSVAYRTVDGGTAVAGLDYLPVSGRLYWANGDGLPKSFIVPIIDNTGMNPDKTFIVELSDPIGPTNVTTIYLESPSNATVTIVNDDLKDPSAGLVDYTFNYSYGANGRVRSLVYDQQQRLYIGGEFTMVNGITQNRLSRLDTNATVDTTFDIGSGFNGAVYTLAYNTNGQLIVGGDFTQFNRLPARRVIVLESNGAPSLTFNATNGPDNTVRAVALDVLSNFTFSAYSFMGEMNARTNVIQVGANAGTITFNYQFPVPFVSPTNTNALPRYTNFIEIVYDNVPIFQTNVVVQSNAVTGTAVMNFGPGQNTFFTIYVNRNWTNGSPWNYSGTVTVGSAADRKIYIAGDFMVVGSSVLTRVARLLPNGSVDLSFYPGAGANNSVYAIAVQTNGQVIIGGSFTAYDGVLMPRIARLNSDGTLDPTFDPGVGADGTVRSIVIQDDGKILIGGDFNTVGGVPRAHIARLNYDGSVDLTFDPDAGANGAVRNIAIQGDKKIVIVGDFTLVNSNRFNRIARLNPDGSVDMNFNPGVGANAPIYGVALANVSARLVIPREATGTELEDRFTVDTGSTYGTIIIDYDFLGVPDNIRIYYDGVLIFDLTTNEMGRIVVNYGPGNSTLVTIVMNEGTGQMGTAWFYTLTIIAGARKESQIAIGGDFTKFNERPRNRVAVLLSDGTLYGGFDPGTVPNLAVYSIGLYTNTLEPTLVGKVVVGGNFSAIVGVKQTNIARLNLDGTVDTNFNVGIGPNGDVRAIALQPDGSVIIGGQFTNVNTVPRAYLARLLTNGLVDPYYNQGVGLNGAVNSMALQPDGKLIVGGAFTRVYGATRNGIARMNANGTVDTTFNPGPGANSVVNVVALQNDGRVLIGGSFTTVWNQQRNGIARLNFDGTLDTTFVPTGIGGSVSAIGIQPDGKIVIGGALTTGSGSPTGYTVARLNADGTLDTSFNTGSGANDYISSIAVEPSGKIVVVGGFTRFNYQQHNRIVRLNPDGSIDATISFGTGANNFISALALDIHNRKIIVGGGFSEFNGEVRYAIARIFAGENTSPGEIQFSAPVYNVSEGSNYVEVLVVRNQGGIGNVSVNYSTVDNTAVSGVDYVGGSGRLDFAPGEVMKTLRIGIIDNQIINPPRAFGLLLFNPVNGATLGSNYIATVNILENDSVISFAMPEFTVVEGVSNARVSVVRSGGVEDTVSVVCTTGTNGSATPYFDFLPVTATLIFNPGVRVQTFDIPIVDDIEVELPETVELQLIGVSGSAALGMSNAVLKIVDNDVSPGTISFATNYFTVIENYPAVAITVTRTNGYSGVVSVNYTVGVGGTATPGQDYIITNGVLTFAEFETNKTFYVQIKDDLIIEGTETVLMRLSNPTGGARLGLDTAVLAILDDDSAGSFVFSQPVFVASEGDGAAVITVNRIGGSIGAVSVTVMTGGGTAAPGLDYVTVSNVLNFANGEINKTIAVPILDDAIVEEPETVGLILANPTGGAVVGALGQASLVIVDNEVGISFSQPAYSVSETGIVAVVSVARYGNTNIVVSARYGTSDGTANAGLDYIGTNGVVEFAAGQTNQYIFVPVIDDTLPEANETFNITLSSPSPGVILGPNITVPVTIIENDDVLYFSASTYTVVESYTNVVITVLRAGNTNSMVSIEYALSGGTATPFPLVGYDYLGTNGVLTFAPGQISNSFQVLIFDDYYVEGPETVNLALLNPTGGAVVGNQRTAVLVIEDNDASVGFASTNFVAAEKSTNAVITLVRKGIATGEVSVVFMTTNLTAVAGQDYIYTSNVVRWAAGDLSPKQVYVPLIDDSIPEGAETVAMLLSNPTGGVVLETNFAYLTIVDNAGVIAFSSQSYRVSEDQVNAVITLIRSGGSNGQVSIKYSAYGGTATAGLDYNNPTGVVAFADGEIIKTVLIPIVRDSILEGPETVYFTLSEPQGGAMIGSPSTTVLTIYDSQIGIIEPAGTALIYESQTPTNNIIDPNETVTIMFGLRNAGYVNTTNLVATLLPGNGITNIRTNTQSYGALQADGSVVSRPFMFTVSATNGAIVTAQMQLTDGGANLGIVTFTFIVGRVPSTFCNADVITIRDNTNAVPYPSVINVSGVPGVISKLTVTINGLNHSYPKDIDILLVSPTGQKAVLLSDAGGGFALNNVTLTFDASATAFVPEDGQIVSGTYRPTNYLAADIFPPSAPEGPYDSDLNVFNGQSPNGYWALYVVDDDRMDSGVIAGGWCISFITTEGVLPSADLSVSVIDTPDPVRVGGTLTYTAVVTNHGPATATGVILNNELPAGVTLLSVFNPYGQVTTNQNIISAYIGTMPAGAVATVTLQVRAPATPVLLTNRAWVTAIEPDQNTAGNESVIKTVVAGIPPLYAVQKGQNILLSWPADAGTYTIEYTTALGQPWLPVTNASAPIVVGGYYNVTIPIESGNRFYRLRLGQ